jgi:hypothetical protein
MSISGVRLVAAVNQDTRTTVLAVICAVALVAFAASSAVAQPAQQQPPGTGIVCATKGGRQQSYWNEQDARRDGAIVLYPGECPSPEYGESGG